jgi:5-methylcytosine-specific restriction endonuclease McrA
MLLNKKTLLLNNSFEVLSFVCPKKALKLIFKDKVEIINEYEEEIIWISGKIKYPSVLRLKHQVKRNYFNTSFSRKAVLKRDDNCCQYCWLKLTPSKITIDHIKPKVQGGLTSFTNCVVACQSCNSKKGGLTPDQAGMKLLKIPNHPSFINIFINKEQDDWNQDWNYFVK